MERIDEIKARLEVVTLRLPLEASGPTILAVDGDVIAETCWHPDHDRDALAELFTHSPEDIRYLLERVAKEKSHEQD